MQGGSGDPSLESESETLTLPPQLQEKYGISLLSTLGLGPLSSCGGTRQ